MTYGQLGWVDGLAFAFAILLEVPSGAVADLIGKKMTIMIGMLAGFAGGLLIASTTNFNNIFIGWFIMQIAYAFYSGAGEALAYDTLVENGNESDFDKVITKSHSYEMYTTATTTIIGGFAYTLWDRAPQFLWISGFLFAFIASHFLIEPTIDTIKFSFKNYFSQLFIGIKILFGKRLREYLIFILVLPGVYAIYTWGFTRPAMAISFGFGSIAQSIIYASLTLSLGYFVRFIPWIRNKNHDLRTLVILALLMSFGFAFASFNVGYFGLIAMIAIAVAGKISSPVISIVINKEIPSKYRATTLSTVSLITKLPYVIVAILLGDMLQNGQLNIFTASVASLILLVVLVSVLLRFIVRNN